MKTLPELPAGRQDDLKAENELLKLKLELEHGMKGFGSNLGAEIENKWLQSIYDFENQARNAKMTKVYDYLGQPEFRERSFLSDKEVSIELKRLMALMAKNNISLDCIKKYPDAVIYSFITEVLFNKEIEDIRIDGMTWNFIYEEFVDDENDTLTAG